MSQSNLLTILIIFCLCGSFITSFIISDSVAFQINKQMLNTYNSNNFMVDSKPENFRFTTIAGNWSLSSVKGLYPSALDYGSAEIWLRKINVTNDSYVLTQKYNLNGMLNNDNTFVSFILYKDTNWIQNRYYFTILSNGVMKVEHMQDFNPFTNTYVCPINLNDVIAPGIHNFTIEFSYNWGTKKLSIFINDNQLSQGINFDLPVFNNTYEAIYTNNLYLEIWSDYHTYSIITGDYNPNYNSWDAVFGNILIWNIEEQYLPWVWNIILVKLPLALAFFFGIIRIFVGG